MLLYLVFALKYLAFLACILLYSVCSSYTLLGCLPVIISNPIILVYSLIQVAVIELLSKKNVIVLKDTNMRQAETLSFSFQKKLRNCTSIVHLIWAKLPFIYRVGSTELNNCLFTSNYPAEKVLISIIY